MVKILFSFQISVHLFLLKLQFYGTPHRLDRKRKQSYNRAKCIYADLRGTAECLNRLFGKYIGCEEVTRFATYCSIVYV